jgi:hypothetical protein
MRSSHYLASAGEAAWMQEMRKNAEAIAQDCLH